VDAASLVAWARHEIPQLSYSAREPLSLRLRAPASQMPPRDAPASGWLRHAAAQALRRLRPEGAAASIASADAAAPTGADPIDPVRPESRSLGGPATSNEVLRWCADGAEPARESVDGHPSWPVPDRRLDDHAPAPTARHAAEPPRARQVETSAGMLATAPPASRPTAPPLQDDAAGRVEHHFGFPPLVLNSSRHGPWPRENPPHTRADRVEPRSSPYTVRSDGATAFDLRPDDRTDDDLDILADKLKRILNDEARRFGLDV
jgi:hypothetical protein